MNNQATQEKLTQMRLWGMQRAFRGVLEGGIGAKYTADELIGHLVDAEWDERHNRRLARLLKGARFRYQASFEQIDFRRGQSRQECACPTAAGCRSTAMSSSPAPPDGQKLPRSVSAMRVCTASRPAISTAPSSSRRPGSG